MALSLTDSNPVVLPVAVGLNTILIVHFNFAARLLPHVVAETLKAPLVEMVMPFKLTFWSFIKVNILAVLALPTAVLGNAALTGVSFACTMPVPESDTVCGLPVALSVNDRVPVCAPSLVGLKVTLTLHVLPIASVDPQVVEEIAKPALGTMLVMSRVAVPVFFRVTDLAALVLSIATLPKARDVGVRVTVVALAAATDTLTASEAMPFATTTRLLAPDSMLPGIVKSTETELPGAIELLLGLVVLA